MRFSEQERRHPFATILSFLLLTFIVLFPKGGVKIAGVPLTWGYAILGSSAVVLAVVRVLRGPLRYPIAVLAAAASLVPFQILYLYSYRQNGVDSPGYSLATFVGFFLLPAAFLLVFQGYWPLLDRAAFERYFRLCIVAAALWGIFLFFWHPVVGSFIEIPYLTVNADDYGQIELTKHIARGRFSKLISTYNNGNVYGLAMLIVLPLYGILEPKRWKRNVLRFSLLLTLSRTVWAGLMIEQILSFAPVAGRFTRTFPELYRGTATRKILAVFATLGLISVGLLLNSWSISVFFDPTIGGRSGELGTLATTTLLPSLPLTGFTELTYNSALQHYGVAGFFAVVLIFAGPVLYLGWAPRVVREPTRRAAAKGLILYSIVAAVDGATNLIPVMAFYWFTYLILLCGLPGRPSDERTAKRSRPALPDDSEAVQDLLGSSAV